MQQRRATSAIWIGAIVLAGCTAAPTTPGPDASTNTPTPPTASSTLPMLGSDAESETLCYAEDIQLTRPANGPLRAKRCIRAGYTITATVFPEPGGRVGQARSSDDAVASVTTTPRTDGSAVLLIRTQRAGDAVIQVPLAAFVASGGQTMELTQAPPSFTLTVSVS